MARAMAMAAVLLQHGSFDEQINVSIYRIVGPFPDSRCDRRDGELSIEANISSKVLVELPVCCSL
jgi:hypothetical protein